MEHLYTCSYQLNIWQQHNAKINAATGQELQLTSNNKNGIEWDCSDFDHGMVVGPRQADLSILESVDVLGFSCITISRVYLELCKKTFSENQFCRRKWLVRAETRFSANSKKTLSTSMMSRKAS